MAKLTTDQALAIVAAARAKARELKCALAYAVVDDGGNVLAMVRDEAAAFLRSAIAINKAWGCIAMGIPSRTLRDHAEGWENWFTGISGAAGGRLVPTLGGVIVRDAAGAIVGAFGTSGGIPGDIDEACAVHGVTAAGFTADVGEKKK
ncbi:MAG: heme-binding protein [Proteobacteria bacterium]|jgi:uncharacterized protein GlcG (DUF336 family)|nr:heme-binding protein [Pseudomonadota bacterium]